MSAVHHTNSVPPDNVGRLCESAKHLPKRLRRMDVVRDGGCPIYFLTICTARRAPLLADTQTHKEFLQFCHRSPEVAGAWVGRYVLMPDHIHAFVSAEGSAILSHWVGSLKKTLASHWRKRGHIAPFWQEVFFDHLLRGHESYQEKWMYVLQNPVRAGLAAGADQWLFAGDVHPIELSEDQRRIADSQSRPTSHKVGKC